MSVICMNLIDSFIDCKFFLGVSTTTSRDMMAALYAPESRRRVSISSLLKLLFSVPVNLMSLMCSIVCRSFILFWYILRCYQNKNNRRQIYGKDILSKKLCL